MSELTLQDIRDYAYSYLELDTEDMPVALVDQWAEEGFTRIHRMVKRFPHFQHSETVATEASVPTVTTTLVEVQSILGPDGPLDWMDHSEAKRHWIDLGTPYPESRPRSFSQWGGLVYLWPVPDGEYFLQFEGHRAPAPFTSQGAGVSPDLPEDFHQLVRSWVMHRVYQHQDDFEGAALEKQQFDELLGELLSNENQAPTTAPLILGGGRRNPIGLPPRLLYPWE